MPQSPPPARRSKCLLLRLSQPSFGDRETIVEMCLSGGGTNMIEYRYSVPVVAHYQAESRRHLKNSVFGAFLTSGLGYQVSATVDL